MNPRPARPARPSITIRKKGRGCGTSIGILIAVAIAAFFLQYRWMQGVREKNKDDLISEGNPFAQKVQEMMLKQKGLLLPPEEAPSSIPSGSSLVKHISCHVCLETGRLMTADGMMMTCPVCKGVGYHVVRYFTGEERLCPACSGMGRAPQEDGTYAPCSRCDGRGLLDAPHPAVADEP